MLVANWKEVLQRSLVVWVSVLTALLPEVPDLVLKWLASDQSAQILTPEQKNYIRAGILLFVVPFLRIWRQQSIATATEKKLEEERLARLAFEKEATSTGPPISESEAKAIRRDAAEAVKG